jgi:hypothetical protein
VPVQTDRAFTFDTIFSATYNGRGSFAAIKQQPASPTQHCVFNNAAIVATGAANVTNISVICAEYSYATNAGDGTISAYAVNASNGALASIGPPVATGKSPYAVAGTRDKKYIFAECQVDERNLLRGHVPRFCQLYDAKPVQDCALVARSSANLTRTLP